MKLGETQAAVDVLTEVLPGDFASPGRAIQGFRYVRTDPDHVRQMIRAARFWWQVEQSDSHWYWRGPVMRTVNSLTPVFRVSSDKGVDGRSARRVAWELLHGRLPKHRRVLLKCDEPLCVRPEEPHTCLNHEFTPREHGIFIAARGEAAKQVERNVKIRELYRSGLLTLEEIGQLYQLTRERIRQIVEMENGAIAE